MKHKLCRFPILSLVICTAFSFSFAATYYVSNSAGDDSRSASQAQNSNMPWKSLTKVNGATFASGDSILFKRGDVWRGSVTVGTSNTVYSAYGSGNNPVINGATEITGWSIHSGNIYVAPCAQNVTQLFYDGVPLMLARYPDTGYCIIDSVIDTATTFVDNEINASIDWTGAMAHMRVMDFTLESGKISAFDAAQKKITLANKAGYYAISKSWGYFINNHLSALDSPGEWFYDSLANNVYVWLPANENPTGHLMEGSVSASGFSITNKTSIAISGFSIANQAQYGIYAQNCSHLSIQNNTVAYTERGGIFISDTSSSYNTIDGNRISGPNIIGIRIYGRNSVISNNTVLGIGLFARLGKDGTGGTPYGAIGIDAHGNDHRINGNVLDSIGYHGIAFAGQNTIVNRNMVSHTCLTLDDGGGIYTWNSPYAAPGSAGSIVSENIVLSSIGNFSGKPNNALSAHGIYIDDQTHDITVINNTAAYCGYSGIYMHNNRHCVLKNNTMYGNHNTQLKVGSDIHGRGQPMTENTVTNNVMYALSASQQCIYINSDSILKVWSNTIDSNYYCNPYSEVIVKYIGNAYALPDWQNATTMDHATKASRITLLWNPYRIMDTLGSNLISNGGFNAATTGWSTWPAAASKALDSIPALDGKSLRVVYGNDSSYEYGQLYSGAFPLTLKKVYLLRFSTYASKHSAPALTIQMLMSGSPYSVIWQGASFKMDTMRKEQAVVFTPNQTYNSCRINFDYAVEDSVFWLDNVALYEVNATEQPVQNPSRLVYNTASTTQTIGLGGYYSDLDGASVGTSVTLAPFSSKVVVWDSTHTTGVGIPIVKIGQFNLYQNYPNPFNLFTAIRFSLNDFTPVSLKIYNASGREVAALVDGVKPAGEYKVLWNGLDAKGQPMSSGMYYYKLNNSGLTKTKRMVLVK